jgi:hypothetical protein
VAAAQPAAASKDLLRAIKEASTGLGMRGGREVPAAELEMRRGREAVEEMAAQLAATSKAVRGLVVGGRREADGAGHRSGPPLSMPCGLCP